MFDRIAERYDLLNRVISLGLDRRWRRAAVRALALSPGDVVLDLATGTADMALEAVRQQPGVRVIGLDPSPRMLAVGRDKARGRDLGGAIAFGEAVAERLPLRDGAVDAAMIAFGIRNVPDRDAALRELARVTRPGGRVAILELTEPRRGLLASVARAWTRRAVPAIGATLSGAAEYRYLQRSVAAFPDPVSFGEQMARCGLSPVSIRSLGFGACGLIVATPQAGDRR
ncbi:MAG: ubiquinone/menaquinone biosynthesis methyltransferase [Acidobacteria bacterium]|nr:MAG: ubiquinone/menaquinone biosynthesis methyltransferase [Acidobacteriota bacterium]